MAASVRKDATCANVGEPVGQQGGIPRGAALVESSGRSSWCVRCLHPHSPLPRRGAQVPRYWPAFARQSPTSCSPNIFQATLRTEMPCIPAVPCLLGPAGVNRTVSTGQNSRTHRNSAVRTCSFGRSQVDPTDALSSLTKCNRLDYRRNVLKTAGDGRNLCRKGTSERLQVKARSALRGRSAWATE